MRWVAFGVALLSAAVASAQLTSAQLTTLKGDINAATDVVSGATADCGAYGGSQVKDVPNTPDGNACLARVYNLTASPDFWVWRTSVSRAELQQKPSNDSDGATREFIWVGNGYITRSAGEQAAWDALFDAQGFANPSLLNVRTAITDIFSGSGNAASNRTHLANLSKRKATRAEKLFATGTGTHGSPGTMGFEGALTYQQVESARNIP